MKSRTMTPGRNKVQHQILVLLSDGAWHPKSELEAILGDLILPEIAFRQRAYEVDRDHHRSRSRKQKQSQQGTHRPKRTVVVDDAYIIKTGRRIIVGNWLNMLTQRGHIECSGPRGAKRYRLVRKGFETLKREGTNNDGKRKADSGEHLRRLNSGSVRAVATNDYREHSRP